MSRIAIGSVLSCVIFLAIGCGPTVRTGSVSGTVTQSGQFVSNVDVTFSMMNQGIAATARTDTAGAYEIPNILTPGHYSVFLTPAPPEPTAPGSGKSVPVTTTLPALYALSNTTPLQCDVVQGSNLFPIVIEK